MPFALRNKDKSLFPSAMHFEDKSRVPKPRLFKSQDAAERGLLRLIKKADQPNWMIIPVIIPSCWEEL